MQHRVYPLAVATLLATLATFGASQAFAHDAPGSATFDLNFPSFPMTGEITAIVLIAPPPGEQVVHTTWNVNFSSTSEGTLASDVRLDLAVYIGGVKTWTHVEGSDFGWPAATGSFTGTVDTHELNGVLQQGGFSPTTANLQIYSADGGLNGQFTASTITLELADTCQVDLGFGGPGSVELALCGSSLGSGGAAEVVVDGAPAFSTVFLLVGLTSNPTPFKGGTLVPLPTAFVIPLAADANGHIELPVSGGGGPLTVYAQAVVADPAQVPAGYAISNALQIELLP